MNDEKRDQSGQPVGQPNDNPQPERKGWSFFSTLKKWGAALEQPVGGNQPTTGPTFNNNTDAEAGMPGSHDNGVSLVKKDGGPEKPGDGVTKITVTPVTDDKGGKKNDDRPGGYFYRPEPDRPFNPHFFHPRADLLMKSPRVLISADAYKKMLIYVETGRKEVGWMGTVTRLPNGDFLIEDTFLLEQEVTAVETELSTEGQEKLCEELINKDADKGVDQVNRLRFWGHSHVRMGTSPSGTDESTMLRFAEQGLPWYVRGIFNKLGRAEFTVYLYDQGFRICDAPWAVIAKGKGIVLDGQKHRMLSRWQKPWGGWQGGGNSGGENRPYWQGAERSSGNPNAGKTTVDGKSWEEAYGTSKPVEKPVEKPEEKKEEPKEENPYEGLPAELIPSAELRAEIVAEFEQKVTERMPITSFFGSFWGNKDDENKDGDKDGKGEKDEKGKDGGATTGDADADVVRITVEPAGDGAPAGVHGTSTTRKRESAQPNNGQNGAQSGGFWQWLTDLLSSK